MKKKVLLILVAVFIVSAAAFLIYKNKSSDSDNTSQTLTEVTLALDWTPNTNHTGIYVAQQKGFYRQKGIDLKILPYSSNVSSDSLVIAKKADVGIGFTEGIVADTAVKTPVKSIASIIAHNTSVIIARKDAGINSPKDLDGKTYGGYGAPYEEPVMNQVIKNAGGKGEFKNVTVDTDPISALETKKVDFVWVYDGWEGVQAKLQNLDVQKFYLQDYGIPDYSTPNIISSPETINEKTDLLQKFVDATAEGYEFARSNPDESAKMLIESVDDGIFPDENLVYESQRYLSTKYQDDGKKWGVVDSSFWKMYPEFMLKNNAVLDENGNPVNELDFESLYTNQFLNE